MEVHLSKELSLSLSLNGSYPKMSDLNQNKTSWLTFFQFFGGGCLLMIDMPIKFHVARCNCLFLEKQQQSRQVCLVFFKQTSQTSECLQAGFLRPFCEIPWNRHAHQISRCQVKLASGVEFGKKMSLHSRTCQTLNRQHPKRLKATVTTEIKMGTGLRMGVGTV